MTPFQLFGSEFKRLRHAQGLTLRAFCRQHDLDPGNISRLERGRACPPTTQPALDKLLRKVVPGESSEEFISLRDLAYACSGTLPPELTTPEIIARLPLIFCGLRAMPVLDDDKTNQLVALITES